MPYNTRRKSLSLPSLGIQLPQGSRAAPKPGPKSARLPETTASTSSEGSPPSKRVKRSHQEGPPSPARTSSTPTSAMSPPPRRKKDSIGFEATPPPSPMEGREIDIESIHDEIVVGVIRMLQRLHNKPILVKDIATELQDYVAAVQTSNNPHAIISSRLAGYLKRKWTAEDPCPLSKELVASHPRRTYYYLNTMAHPPIIIQATSAPLDRLSIISPSLTDDDEEARQRMEMSPSPEVDLTHPELDEPVEGPPTPAGTYSGRSSLAKEHTGSNSEIALNRLPLSRPASPVLEHEEREFHTAASMIEQRSIEESDRTAVDPPVVHPTIENQDVKPVVAVETEEDKAMRNAEAAAIVFGHQSNTHLSVAAPSNPELVSSPVVKPTQLAVDTNRSGRSSFGMTDIALTSPFADADLQNCLKSPEQVGLEDLDALWSQFPDS